MREVHGVVGVGRVNSDSSTTQQVRVMDGVGEVIFYHTSSDAAGLTPDEARFIAKLLVEAADRVEKANAKPL